VNGLLGGRWGSRSRVNATLVLLIAAGLVALLGAAVANSIVTARDAVASLNTARALTTRRIDQLNGQIARLSGQDARAARQRGLLLAQVEALTEQLRALGVTPVVTSRPHTASPSRTARPSSTPGRRVTPTPRRPGPPPTPTPTPTHGTCVLVVCLSK